MDLGEKGGRRESLGKGGRGLYGWDVIYERIKEKKPIYPVHIVVRKKNK